MMRNLQDGSHHTLDTAISSRGHIATAATSSSSPLSTAQIAGISKNGVGNDSSSSSRFMVGERWVAASKNDNLNHLLDSAGGTFDNQHRGFSLARENGALRVSNHLLLKM